MVRTGSKLPKLAVLIGLSAAVLGLTALSSAQVSSSMNGTFKGLNEAKCAANSVDTTNSIPITGSISVSGGSLSGSFVPTGSPSGSFSISNGIVSGQNVSFEVTRPDGTVVHFTGTVSSSGAASGTFTMTQSGVQVFSGTGSGTVSSTAIALNWSGTGVGNFSATGKLTLTKFATSTKAAR